MSVLSDTPVRAPHSHLSLHTRSASPFIMQFHGQNPPVTNSCNNFLGPPYSVLGFDFISYSIPLFSNHFILRNSSLPFELETILLDFGMACRNPQDKSPALTGLTSSPVRLDPPALCGEEPEWKGRDGLVQPSKSQAPCLHRADRPPAMPGGPVGGPLKDRSDI